MSGNLNIKGGYVLECLESVEAHYSSYDDMQEVGRIRIFDKPTPESGDDLNDCPYISNGGIYSGEEISIEKGDLVFILKKHMTVEQKLNSILKILNS